MFTCDIGHATLGPYHFRIYLIEKHTKRIMVLRLVPYSILGLEIYPS